MPNEEAPAAQSRNPGAQTPILEVRGLTKRYGRRAALQDVTILIPPGRIVGLLGPNGAGKTTLIKIVAGVESGYSGTVRVCGMPVGPGSKAAVSYLPDRISLGPWMRVRDAVDYYADFYADFDRAKALELAQRLRLDLSAPLARLSKGTREKVQLVLAISRAARLYLLDEPIGGVDPAARDVILDTILSQYAEGGSMLLSTQIVADVERMFDSVVFLRQGAVILTQDVDVIRERFKKSVDGLFREVFRC